MKRVCIIGGGISGIASAVFLAKEGYDVSLFEATSKLGGRTYSIADRYVGTAYDNGKHIFAGWYENTFELLSILNTKSEILNSRFRLAISYGNVLLMSDERKQVSLLDYLLLLRKAGLIGWSDLWQVFKQYIEIKSARDSVFCKINDFLSQQKVSANLLNYFWMPLIHSIFNCALDDVDFEVVKNLIRKIGFNKSRLSFFCPAKTLNEIFIQPAINFFRMYGVKYYLNSKVSRLLFQNGRVKGIAINGGIRDDFDYYISAVRADQFQSLVDGLYQMKKSQTNDSESKPIISVHLFVDENLLNSKLKGATSVMLAIFEPVSLWLFKNGQNYLSFTISNAKKYINYDRGQILHLCIKVLRENNLGDLNENQIKHFSVVKERFATIVPKLKRSEVESSSVFSTTNFLVCGDWVSTSGFSTIEAAVSSSKLVVTKLNKIERRN